MATLQIEVTYDPTEKCYWISHGEVRFQTKNKRLALQDAARVARYHSSSRIIVYNRAGRVAIFQTFRARILGLNPESTLYIPVVVVVGFIILPYAIVEALYGELVSAMRANRIKLVPVERVLQKRFQGVRTSFRRTRLRRPPGTLLLSIVDFLYPPRIVELTFKPIVADWRTEYFDAQQLGRKNKARWISFRYRFSFIMAMGLSKVLSLLRHLRSVQ